MTTTMRSYPTRSVDGKTPITEPRPIEELWQVFDPDPSIPLPTADEVLSTVNGWHDDYGMLYIPAWNIPLRFQRERVANTRRIGVAWRCAMLMREGATPVQLMREFNLETLTDLDVIFRSGPWPQHWGWGIRQDARFHLWVVETYEQQAWFDELDRTLARPPLLPLRSRKRRST